MVGAGVMGAGIAALAAENGASVLLLDMVDAGGNERSGLAQRAVARLGRAAPAVAALIEAGNIEDDLGKVSGCDWIIETITEQLAAKQSLYRRLEAVRRPGTAVSSNTSSLPLARLGESLPPAFRRDFLITHFFNPPRQMRLLELVAGADSRPGLAAQVAGYCEQALGRRVVRAKDTPGFIANRIGVFWLQQALDAAIEDGLSVEEADTIIGEPLGFSNLGVFGLLDVLGIDLMPQVNARLGQALASDDAFQAFVRERPLIEGMIAKGHIGRKAGSGFYRRGQPVQAIDLQTGEYRACRPGSPLQGRDARTLLAGRDRHARYGWTVVSSTLVYAASLVPTISEDIRDVDTAMRLGFNWKAGPFELLDTLGPRAVAERLRAEGRQVPRLLDQVGEGTFYAELDGEPAFFGTDGAYHVMTPGPPPAGQPAP